MSPKISIIIAVRNMPEGLARAIESVILQNYPNKELIVIDGASTDGTVEVIKKYAEHIAHWQSGKDLGHCDACNKGLTFATGDFINLLNADDEMMPGALEAVAKAHLEHTQAEVITYGVQIVKNEVKTTHSSPAELELNLHNMLLGLPLINARFFHKNLFSRLGEFKAVFADGKYYISNDRYYMSRLALHNVKNVTIPQAFYIYHAHEGSLTFSKTNVLRTNEEHIWLAEQLLAEYKLATPERRIVLTWLAKETCYRFCRLLAAGEVKEAFVVAALGLRKCGLTWPGQLFATVWRGMAKKLS